MQRTATRLIIAISLFTTKAAPAAPVHVVFDIDRTIAVHVNIAKAEWAEPEQALNPARFLFINDDETLYHLYEGVEETVLGLLHLGAKVSFFSKGDVARNEELLGKFKLPGGLPLRRIATKVLSAPDMPDGFKDLRLIDADIGNVLLVDDTPSYVKPDQLLNWLPVQRDGPDSFKDAALILGQTVLKIRQTGISASAALQATLVEREKTRLSCPLILEFAH